MNLRIGASFGALMMLFSAAYAAGEAPGNPLALEIGATAEGETSRAVFYRVTPARSGMLAVSLTPEGADLDLAVMGPGGNPTVESRRSAMEAEEAAVAVTAGTDYLVRVTSAAGRFGRYKLKAEMRGGPAARAAQTPTSRPASGAAMPGPGQSSMMHGQMMSGHMTASAAAEMPEGTNLPLGYFVPDQIDAPKTYRLQTPMGLAVSVVLRPVMGDPSLTVRSADGSLSGSSARPGMLPEEVEIPAGNSGWIVIEVVPGTDGTARFYLGTSPRLSSSAISPAMGMNMGMNMGMQSNPWGMPMMDPSMMGSMGPMGQMNPMGMQAPMQMNPWMMQSQQNPWGMYQMYPWMMQPQMNQGWGWQ